MNAVLAAAITSGRGDATISGKVVHGGQPVAGATVTATRSQGDETLSELECHCDNHCGLRLLECGCPEAAEQLRALVAERRGEVVPVARTHSAADGTFTLTGLEPGTVALWADDRALGTTFAQSVAVGSSTAEITYGDGFAIEGSIKLDTGAPVPGAWVTAIHPEHSRFFDAVADGEGHFKLGPLPPGRYSVVAGAAGLLTGQARASKDSESHLVINLARPQALDGVVLLEGKPVGGVAVHLEGNHRKRDVMSAADGSFRFSALYPGSYELSGRKGTLGAYANAEASEKHEGPVKLELHDGTELTGVVKTNTGAPIGGSHVSLSAEEHSSGVWADAEGRYQLQGVSGANATLRASATGYSERREHLSLEGGQMRHDVTLTPEATVAGTVIGPAGTPVDDAIVRAVASSGGTEERPWLRASATGQSSDGGAFLLHGLEAGSYRLTVTHAEYRGATLETSAPAAGLRLTLEAGETLIGEVVGPAGTPESVEIFATSRGAAGGDTFRSGLSDATGHFTLHGLWLEPYTVTAHRTDDSAKAVAKLTIARGENHVRLQLEETLTIEGTVVRADGGPLPRMMFLSANGPNGSYADARINTDGTFALKGLRPGEHKLMVAGAEDEELATVKAGTKGVRIVLGSTTITGRVVARNGKTPASFHVNGSTYNDPSGKFTLRVPQAGEVEVTVYADGYLPVSRRAVVEKNQTIDIGEVVIGEGRDVRIEVVSMQGEPLDRADVWLNSEWTNNGGASGFTDKSGVLILHGVNGAATLMVNHPTHAPAVVELGETDTGKKVSLEAGGSLQIHVTDAAGKPRRVWLHLTETGGPAAHGYDASTNAAGDYLGEGMTPGTWLVTALDEDGSQGTGTATLENEKRQRLELKLGAGH